MGEWQEFGGQLFPKGFFGSREVIIRWERLLVSHVYHLYEYKWKLQTELAAPGTE